MTARQEAQRERLRHPDLNAEHIIDATPAQVEQQLGEYQTAGYKPMLPIYQFRDEYWNPFDFFWDIESMLKHDSIITPMANVMAPVGQMQVKMEASSTRIVKFLLDQWQNFLENYVPLLQEDAYPYGWMAGECVYATEGGKYVLDDFHDFHPRDTLPLVQKGKVVGVQVRQGIPSGSRDLPNFRGRIPCKGFWYAHRPRYGQRYGRSQIEGAWKPWRRLTGREGAEEMADIALYRYATGIVVIWAPIEDTVAQWQANAPGTRQSSVQRAMEMGENLKAGGSIAMPSTVYSGTNTPKWDIKFETPQTNIPELLSVQDSLYDKCSKAILFPPELMDAAETGSGYSGRQIPLEAFLMQCQRTCQGIFHAWWKQIGKPLMWWNFGSRAWCKPRVVPLLKSFKQASQPVAPGGVPGAAPGGGQPMPAPGGGAPPQGAPAPQPAQGQSEAPAPSGGKPGKIPYIGPRGGRGWKGANGVIHYGATLSTGSQALDRAAAALEQGIAGESEEQALRRLAKQLPDLEPEELEALEWRVSQEAA